MVEEAGGGGLLTVEGGLVIWTLVVFGLLLFILKRSAWPVLLQAVREREQRLERQLAGAKKDIEEEKAKAILALRREAVDLSIAAASRLIAQNLDSEANRRLALEYLASLEQRR